MTTTPARAEEPTLQDVRRRMLQQVEERMDRFVAGERARWCAVDPRAGVPIDAVASLLRAGGKRIRPVFCLSGYLAVGGDPHFAPAVDAAAALELLQAFALIHDDVLDDSSMRRGAVTTHVQHAAEHARLGWQGESRRFGDGIAILAGDLAYAWADRLATALSPAARAVWDELRTEMIIGQSLDIVVAAEQVADPELARWIALCKSGHYTIHRPLLLGATIAGRPDLTGAFEEYGLAVGEAFQLRDDLIDAFGDSQASGKPAGLDFDQHKMTLLLALVAQRDERVRELVGGGGDADRPGGGWDAAALRSLLVDAGVRADVERHIDDSSTRHARRSPGRRWPRSGATSWPAWPAASRTGTAEPRWSRHHPTSREQRRPHPCGAAEYGPKRTVGGTVVKVLVHRREDRGMSLELYASRCVQVGEAHELVTPTTGRPVRIPDRRVAVLGLAEIPAPASRTGATWSRWATASSAPCSVSPPATSPTHSSVRCLVELVTTTTVLIATDQTPTGSEPGPLPEPGVRLVPTADRGRPSPSSSPRRTK